VLVGIEVFASGQFSFGNVAQESDVRADDGSDQEAPPVKLESMTTSHVEMQEPDV
jgi:hypothetical protein